MKITLTNDQLKEQLYRQVALLKTHLSSYELQPIFALDIATKIRVLCYDTKRQSSLLSQLGLKDKLSIPGTFALMSEDNPRAPFCGLVYANLDWTGARFVPKFDKCPKGHSPTILSFDEWWSTCILRDYVGRELTRGALILEMANTDGGAHVDGALKEDYHFISRQHSLTWKFSKNKEPEIPVSGVEMASVFQIGYELALAIDPGFPAPILTNKGMLGEFSVNGSPGIAMFGRPLPFRMEMSFGEPKSSERNEPCKCGSGDKAKKCCPNGLTVAMHTDPV